jgi:hypothetical protein
MMRCAIFITRPFGELSSGSVCICATSNAHTPFNQLCGAAARALDELALQHAVAAVLCEVVDTRGSQDSGREGKDDD